MPESPQDTQNQALAAGDLLEYEDQTWVLVPGQFYDDIPNEAYHRGPGVSSSNLKTVGRSPLHYRTEKDHPKPSTPAMQLGTALHTLVLEPDVFDATYVAEPVGAPNRPTDKQLKAKKPSEGAIAAIAFWQQWDAENEGRIVLSTKAGDDPFWKPSEWDQIHYMRDAVREHPLASCFLASFVPERSLYWREPIMVRLESGGEVEMEPLAKARFDIMDSGHNLGADIKTAIDASYSGFTRAIVDYGYHISRQWYMRGQRACGFDLQEFVFIVVEKQPPYAVGVYTVDKRFQEIADSLIRAQLETYARCQEIDHWPAYPVEVRELQTPRYAEFNKIS